MFPKSSRWLISQKIANEAVDSLSCIKRANAINVKNAKDYEYRRDQQMRAYAHLEALLSLIDISFQLLNIEGHRIEHWVGLVLQTENSLKNWGRSDQDRYKAVAQSNKE